MQSFILAGGFATRLWPLTERRAKPLLPLAGKPLLTHLVERIPKDLPITVSTNTIFADDMKEWAKTISERSIEVMVEDTAHDAQKLGALGAVSKWIREQNMSDDILLLAGDNYMELDLSHFRSLFKASPLLAAHDIGSLDQARSFGTVIVEQSSNALKNVTAFEEKPAHPKSTLVSTGCYILPAATLPVLCEYAVTHPDNVGGIFEEFLKRNLSVDCFAFTETWKDIGSFEAYMSLHREITEKPVIDAQATLENTRLEGAVAIGPRAEIRNSTLTDCIIFGQCRIEDCALSECIIDVGCDLKGVDLTKKMIRHDTRLRA